MEVAAGLSLNVRTPTLPAVCGPPLVLEEFEAVHVEGSGVPAFHTRARIVVGLAPLACVRNMYVLPALNPRLVLTSPHKRVPPEV